MDPHLSQITTTWTVFFQAHSGSEDQAREARRQLLERYGEAVFRYLRAAVKDEEAASELYQEFGLRLVQGKFQRAHPDRGRFRAFLKTSLYHLVINYHTRKRKPALPLTEDIPDPGRDAPALPESDEEFQKAWRTELLTRTWQALQRVEQETSQPCYTVLRFRADHPEMASGPMADQLSARLGKSVTAGWVRKQLYLARDRFTALLLEELRQTLENPTVDNVEQELTELGLLQYCRRALDQKESEG
jgi:RNA polymerase sigma-70 factor (ECF subfamily)